MVGDLILAFMPMFLIWRLSRSVVERCLISFLMAMGLFATGAGVMKIMNAYTYVRMSGDSLREMMPEFLWCRIEEILLIIACSAPLLKSPVGHALRRVGFSSFQEKTRELNSFHSLNFSPAFERDNLQIEQGVAGNGGSSHGRGYDEEKGRSGDHSLSTDSSTSTLEGWGGFSLVGKPMENMSSSALRSQ
jgi:hypothetical protein